MVVGWRIQLMVQLGREVPELPGELLFSDGELRVLATFARSRTLPPPTRLGDAVGLVGRLAGGEVVSVFRTTGQGVFQGLGEALG